MADGGAVAETKLDIKFSFPLDKLVERSQIILQALTYVRISFIVIYTINSIIRHKIF